MGGQSKKNRETANAGWFTTNVIEPTKQLTFQQIFVAVGIGIWGGIFPIPITTTLALFGAIGLANALPRSRCIKFNVPMTTLATAVNIAVLPLDLLMMPVFFGRGCSLIGSTTKEMGCEINDQLKKNWRTKCSGT